MGCCGLGFCVLKELNTVSVSSVVAGVGVSGGGSGGTCTLGIPVDMQDRYLHIYL